MIEFISVSTLEKSIKSFFIVGLILLFRKKFNHKGLKWANIILWIFLFIYLLFPYSILIQIKDPYQYGVIQFLLKPMLLVNEYTRAISKEFGYLLSTINRTIISTLFFIYVAIQIVKRNKAMKKSTLIVGNHQINEHIESFGFRRTVAVYVNNHIKTPITYGVIRPRIILQNSILEDTELLKYAITHELIHIKKFDILLNHFKNLVTCLYWHNLLIFASSRYMEDDIEILCDKSVIQKLGDTPQTRKEYCLSMMKLVEQNQNQKSVVLKLNPTIERMKIMKKWKKGLSGVFSLLLVIALSTTAFADVRVVEKETVISSEIPEQMTLYASERVQVISDDEYNSLTLGEIPLDQTRAANIDSTVTIDGLTHKSYKFNMSSWTEPNHDGFTVKMSNMYSKDGLGYAIIIKENGRTIYNESFTKATTLTVKAYHNSRYEVIINNQSTNSLSYRVKINSYIR